MVAAAALFKDFVGEQQERFRDRQAKPSGGLQVHHQTEFCRQLNGKVARICATQNAINVGRGFTHRLQLINSVRNQPAARHIKAEWVHRRQLELFRNANERVSFRRRERARCYDQSAIPILGKVREYPLEITGVTNAQP